MTTADKTILERIRRDLVEESEILSVKVRMAGRDDRLAVLSMKATIAKKHQAASNIERIIAQ